MIPATKDNYLGIEIEFIADIDIEAAKEELIAANLDSHCELDIDGSVRWDDTDSSILPPSVNEDYDYIWEGFELRVLCKETELFSLLPKIKKFFINIGADVNKTCGLHVHLDMRNRDLKLMYSKLIAAQDEMFQIVSAHRKANEFCIRNKVPNNSYNKFMNEVTEGRDSSNVILQRYAINLLAYLKYKTIEIRAHEGTINTMEIYNWCSYLLSIIGAKDRTERVARYVQQRIKQNAGNS